MDFLNLISAIKKSGHLNEVLNNLLNDAKTEEKVKTHDNFFELSIDMLCIAGMDGYFKKVSKSFMHTLGYSEKELLSTPFETFVVKEDSAITNEAYNELKSGSPNLHFENRYRCKDGSIKWIAWRSAPDAAGKLVYAIARDITQSKILEENYRIANKKLTDFQKESQSSLQYASYLQKAMLPSTYLLPKLFSDYFLISKPKEILSGDFCWVGKHEQDIYIAVGDCTGHGVPGAMMTIVCTDALNRATAKGNLSSGDILNKTRQLIIEGFSKAANDVSDGMDISFCRIKLKERLIQWSGANLPILIGSGNELIELKGDKQPVGNYLVSKPFKTQELKLAKGSVLYLFSDGYADQFGGPKNKKFMFKRFRNFIADILKLDLRSQKLKILQAFSEWKQDNEQIDDVTILAVKV